ncbi:MAG: PAS domain S-box protein, partial [bacterium]
MSALSLSILAPGLLDAAPEVQIFALHSYSQEYPWTRNQHAGFQQALEDDQNVNAIVSTEYLDTKRHAYDETYASEMARHFRTKYQDYKPAAIYVTDDNALLFARDHLSRIFPATPVFFSGVNDYNVQASLDPSLFTGVFERQDVASNVKLLLSIDKKANDIVCIGDGSSTFQAIEREARTDLLQFHLRVAFLGEKRLDLAMEQLRDLPGKYIFLTTIGGMTDVNGQVMGVRAITKSIASKGRLVLSMEDTYVMEGVLGGVATSGEQQGSNAASLLLAHFQGKTIAELSPVLKSPNIPVFDERALREHGIVLPDDLRDRVVLLNPRLCYYERNRSWILPLLIALAVLIVLLVAWLSLVLARIHSNLSLARKKAEAANDIFNGLALVSRTVHWKVNADGLYTYVSPAASSVLGYRPEDLVGSKCFYDFHPEDGRRAFKDAAFAVFARHELFSNLENTVQTADGTVLWMSTNGQPILDEDGKLSGYSGSDTDITVRKQAEQYHEMDGEILHILSEAGGIDDAIRRTLGVLKKGIGCDAVGIRLQDGDDFPYFDQEGFPKSFLLTENALLGRDKDGSVKRDKTGKAILEGTCGLVLSGKTDKDNPLFTHGGSFWTNDSIKLLDLPSDQDPRLNPRNQCMHHGYASMALVPIRIKGRIVGLIHIDDRRKGLFCAAAIEQLEDIAAHVGEVMARRQAEA